MRPAGSGPPALESEPHPLLVPGVFRTEFDAPLGELHPPATWRALFALEAEVPLRRDESVRTGVRALLRHGGYKPTGRGKPASEYLLRGAGEGSLGSINLAVDACNIVSLHSGLPISVVELERARPPLRIALAGPGESYAFNAAGQTIDLGGLLCLFDAEGPCANAVKDSQRTKTTDTTERTLSVVWGPRSHARAVDAATDWYRSLLERAGARTDEA